MSYQQEKKKTKHIITYFNNCEIDGEKKRRVSNRKGRGGGGRGKAGEEGGASNEGSEKYGGQHRSAYLGDRGKERGGEEILIITSIRGQKK